MTFDEQQGGITDTVVPVTTSPVEQMSTHLPTPEDEVVKLLPRHPSADPEMIEAEEGDEPITSEMSDEEIAKVLARQKAKRLGKTAAKIRKARSNITKQLLLIADLLDSAKADLKKDTKEDRAISPSRLRAFAHVEGGIPRDEIKTYQQIVKMGPSERALLKEQGAGFAVLKAIASNAGLRQDVVDRMRANIPMDIAKVRAVQRQRKLAAETPLFTLLRWEPSRSRIASRKEVTGALKTLEKDSASLALELHDLATAVEISDEEYQARCEMLSAIAKDLMHRFYATIDTDDMPDGWLDLWQSNYDAYGVAEGLLALRTVAFGNVFIPDERYSEGYIETEDTNVDQRLVNAVARLAGIRSPNRGDDDARSPPARRIAVQPKQSLLLSPPEPLISIELCAGAGGQALGLHSAGFHARAIFEKEEDAADTLKQHFPHAANRVFSEDITDVDFGIYRGNIDLLAGGIPCQPFSTAGERKGEADDRDLFRRAVEIVDEIQPRAFFFENVQGFGHTTNMAYRAQLHAAFAALGYQSRVFPILGSNYGLAQGRPRIAFIGFKDEEAMARFRMPPIFPEWHLTLADAIGDLVAADGWKGYEYWRTIANQIAPTIVGGSRKSDKFSFSSGLTREAWELLGVDSRELAKTAPEPDHTGLFRLTLKMGARLQGFPDDWRFQGTERQIKSQIGNALPPIMARAVGLAIYAALENVEFDYEHALKAPLTAPVPPAKPPELRETGLRTKATFENHHMRQQVLNEHEFFGEIIHKIDEWDRESEEVTPPGAFRLKSGGTKKSQPEAEGINVAHVIRRRQF